MSKTRGELRHRRGTRASLRKLVDRPGVTDLVTLRDNLGALNARLDRLDRMARRNWRLGRDYGPVLHDATPITVANTTTQTEIAAYTPSGRMASHDYLRCRISGSYSNTTLAAATLEVSVSLGGTAVWGDSISIPNAIISRAVVIEFEIGCSGNSDSQYAHGSVEIADAAAASVAGTGPFSLGSLAHVAYWTGVDPGVAWATQQEVIVEIQHGTASASIDFTRQVATWERGRGPATSTETV